MTRRRLVTAEAEEEILSALAKRSNALAAARDLGWSFSTVWRVADRRGIDLEDGLKSRSPWYREPERQARVEAVAEANPGTTQEEAARMAGVSRSAFRRIMLARRKVTPG
jgi:hypothetical protein